MTINIARFISLIGHPALLMPLVAAISVANSGEQAQSLFTIFIAVSFALLVVIFCLFKTKTGQWAHVDASQKNERKELNLVASAALLLGAIALYIGNQLSALVVAVALSGAIVLACHLFSAVAKPSLHVGFAVFASWLMIPDTTAVIAILAFAVFIGWSRLCLQRHTGVDLTIGAGIGLFAGASFQLLSQ